MLRIFWSLWKVCRRMSTHSNAHANAKKCIFDSQFPGNWFEFGIIENDFWSSTIWAIQIQDSFAGFKNFKIPGIQPNYNPDLTFLRWVYRGELALNRRHYSITVLKSSNLLNKRIRKWIIKCVYKSPTCLFNSILNGILKQWCYKKIQMKYFVHLRYSGGTDKPLKTSKRISE